MSHVVVIGVGTEDREDDAIGLYAVRDLQAARCPWVDIRESRGDGARMLSLWEGYDAAVIVDALRSSGPLGAIHRIDLAHHPLPSGYLCVSSHQFGVNEAVETARQLQILPVDCILFGVEIGSLRVGVHSVLYEDVRDRLQISLRAELQRWSPEPHPAGGIS